MEIKTTLYFAMLLIVGNITICNAQSTKISNVKNNNSKSITDSIIGPVLEDLVYPNQDEKNESTASSIQSLNSFWSLNGNSGTSSAVNFIGTIDDKDLNFRRNNVFSGRIGIFNTSFGYNSGQGGSSNVNLGKRAGSNSNDAFNFFNVSIGELSGRSNISGSVNSFVGAFSGMSNTTGFGNVFIGVESGKFNTTGNSNTALGYRSLLKNTSGVGNIALSNASLQFNDSGNHNIAIGIWSLQKNTTGSENIGIGHAAGQLSTGNSNIFFGQAAGSQLQTGDRNLFMGSFTGHFLTEGSTNIFIGSKSGYSTSSGNSNLFLGNNSGINLGSNNIIIGENSGGNSGNGNILLGNNSKINPGFQPNPLENNILNIANVIFGCNMNRISSADNTTAKPGMIGINNSVPKNTLEIKSDAKNTSGLRFTNLKNDFNPTSSTNKFLSVDQNGDVVLQNATMFNTTNVLTSIGNTMTSVVNSMSSTAPIVNSISNQLNASNQLTTTVNGVSSTPITLPIPTFVEIDGSTTNEIQTLTQSGNTITLSNGGGSFTLPIDTDNQTLTLTGNNLTIADGNTVTLPTTQVIAGTNVTVTGNGSAATPFQINAIDTSLYQSNGSINQATTTGANRIVDMNSRNIWFNTTSSATNGKIYIGSNAVYPNTTGNYKLFVEGGILTEKVKVAVRTTANWADYVFDENYNLKPLSEVEKFIQIYKHLPGIESADELFKNGLDVAEMQSKQMAKIEELTLYIIQQNKAIEEQKNELSQQRKQLEELQNQVNILLKK